MDAGFVEMLAMVVWLISAVITGIVINGKNRSVLGWSLLNLAWMFVLFVAMGAISLVSEAGVWVGVLLSPACLLLALASPAEHSDASDKKCPYCAEWVKTEAVVCKHCGKDLPGVSAEKHKVAPALEQGR